MKKIIGILVMGVCLNACEKQPFDYRNKFVGEYEFTTLIIVYSVSCCEDTLSCCIKESQVIYQGEITYGKNQNEIIIDYIEDDRDFYPYNNEWRVEEGKLHIIVDNDGNSIGFKKNGDINFNVSFTGKTPDGITHVVKGKKL